MRVKWSKMRVKCIKMRVKWIKMRVKMDQNESKSQKTINIARYARKVVK